MGVVNVTVRPNRRGKRLVAHHRYAILIRLWVSYTPTGGIQRDIGLYGVRITHPKQRQPANADHPARAHATQLRRNATLLPSQCDAG